MKKGRNKVMNALLLAGFVVLLMAGPNSAVYAQEADVSLPLTSSVPTPLTPGGTITDTTPTYEWTKVDGATRYRFKLKEGTTLIYTDTLAASACGATTCTKTPSTVLAASSYKWKVQAKVGGVWGAYSAFKKFTVSVPSVAPKAGLWTGPDGIKFYVTVDQQYVNHFYVIVNIPGCSTTIHWGPILTPITNNIFSYTTQQALYLNAEGTFDSDTTAHGTASVIGFPSTICGINVSVGPIDWTASWRNSSQPSIVAEEADAPEFSMPELQDDSYNAAETNQP